MSQCGFCGHDDIFSLRARHRPHDLVWLCKECKDNAAPVVRVRERHSLVMVWPLLGWLMVMAVLLVVLR